MIVAITYFIKFPLEIKIKKTNISVRYHRAIQSQVCLTGVAADYNYPKLVLVDSVAKTTSKTPVSV